MRIINVAFTATNKTTLFAIWVVYVLIDFLENSCTD